MKVINFFLTAIGFLLSFVFQVSFLVVGFVYASMKTGFEVGILIFTKMDQNFKKYMSVK